MKKTILFFMMYFFCMSVFAQPSISHDDFVDITTEQTTSINSQADFKENDTLSSLSPNLIKFRLERIGNSFLITIQKDPEKLWLVLIGFSCFFGARYLAHFIAFGVSFWFFGDWFGGLVGWFCSFLLYTVLYRFMPARYRFNDRLSFWAGGLRYPEFPREYPFWCDFLISNTFLKKGRTLETLPGDCRYAYVLTDHELFYVDKVLDTSLKIEVTVSQLHALFELGESISLGGFKPKIGRFNYKKHLIQIHSLTLDNLKTITMITGHVFPKHLVLLHIWLERIKKGVNFLIWIISILSFRGRGGLGPGGGGSSGGGGASGRW